MKKWIFLIACFTVLSSFVEIESNRIFKKLYALEGMWIMHTPKRITGETWKKVNDSLMTGKGFFIKGLDTVITENISLRLTSEGIYYVPVVENQNNRQPVSFKLTSWANGLYIFENPLHDFPKRIMYEFAAPDSMHATIDGGKHVQEKGIHFYFKKVK